MTATTMAECGPEIALLGSISGLVFKAISYMFDAVVGTASNLRFTYVVGGLKGSAAASYPAGSGGGILPIFFGDPEDQQDAADAHYFVTSALVTERPAGGSWAVADINNLTNVALAYDYAAGSTECTMVVAELWIEVYGASGSVPEPIIMRQKIGMPVRKETAGDVIEANQQLGTAVISKRMKFKATV